MVRPMRPRHPGDTEQSGETQATRNKGNPTFARRDDQPCCNAGQPTRPAAITVKLIAPRSPVFDDATWMCAVMPLMRRRGAMLGAAIDSTIRSRTPLGSAFGRKHAWTQARKLIGCDVRFRAIPDRLSALHYRRGENRAVQPALATHHHGGKFWCGSKTLTGRAIDGRGYHRDLDGLDWLA